MVSKMNFDKDRAQKAVVCSPLLPPPGDTEVCMFAQDWLEHDDKISLLVDELEQAKWALENADAGWATAMEEISEVKDLLMEALPCVLMLNTGGWAERDDIGKRICALLGLSWPWNPEDESP